MVICYTVFSTNKYFVKEVKVLLGLSLYSSEFRVGITRNKLRDFFRIKVKHLKNIFDRESVSKSRGPKKPLKNVVVFLLLLVGNYI